MTGKILQNEFVVMDVIPLPVEGTETRVSAMAEGYEYMVNYVTSLNRVGKEESVVGWYHSHPGYGCWLSGIDVNTQRQSQTFQDPFLALVIDPNATIAAGKVEIGAFRTYPLNSQGRPIKTAENAAASSKTAVAQVKQAKSQAIPSAKIKDFGVHADFYYQLSITYFKSSLDSKLLDLLWNKYWTSTLSQSPLLTNYDYTTRQIQENALKTEAATQSLSKQLLNAHETFYLHAATSTKGKAAGSSGHSMSHDGIYLDSVMGGPGASGGAGRDGVGSAGGGGKTVPQPTYPLLGTIISNFNHSDGDSVSPSGPASSAGLSVATPQSSAAGGRIAATTKKKKTNSTNSSTVASASHEGAAKQSKRPADPKLRLPANIVLTNRKMAAGQTVSAFSAALSSTAPSSASSASSASSSGSSSGAVSADALAGVNMEFKDAVVSAVRTGNEQLHGLISQELRDQLFATISTHKCEH